MWAKFSQDLGHFHFHNHNEQGYNTLARPYGAFEQIGTRGRSLTNIC